MSANILVLIFVLFGGFALGVQIQFAFTTYSLTSNISDHVMNGVNYRSEVRYRAAVEGESADDMRFHIENAKLETTDDSSYVVSVCALQDDNSPLYSLIDKSGAVIEQKELDGLVINQWQQLHYGVNPGDSVRIVVNGKGHDVRIAFVSDNVYGSTVYTGMSCALETGLVRERLYNGIFTNREIEFDADKHLSISHAENIRSAVESSNQIYILLSVFFLITGIIIGVTILVLSMRSVVENYKKYIAIMKINGYTEKECSGTVLKGFRTVSLIGYLISVPYTLVLCKIMFSLISKGAIMYFPVEINVWALLICLVGTAVVTELIINLFALRLRRIAFREIIED